MKHKHADLIKAWADGAQIEVKHPSNGSWWDANPPCWDTNYKYRIKPEPKPDIVVYTKIIADIESDEFLTCDLELDQSKGDNLRLTFNGETGKLKEAVVL